MKYWFMTIIIGCLFGSCSTDSAEKVKSENKPAPAFKYQLASVEKAGVSHLLKLPAQLTAYEQVSIFPKVNGYVKEVKVDIGSKVSKGSLLMVLEAPELEEAVSQAKERFARSNADYAIDREHYERLLEASQTAGAISPLDLSTARSKMLADSALGNAERSNWQMQQTMEGYLRVTAPFDGVITERNVHPGALVSAEAKDNKPMLELKQVSHLRLGVDIPEVAAGTLKIGDSVFFYTSAFPSKKLGGTVSRKSMNINPEYRSERVEIDVYNHDGSLSPGMYADVAIVSAGNPNSFAIPWSCIVTSTERKYVIVIRDGRTHRVDVTTANTSGLKAEVSGDLREGEKAILNASDEIKDGQPVN